MIRRLCLLPSLVLLAVPLAVAQAPESQPGFVATYLDEARGQLAAGDVVAARIAIERGIERDARSLPALQLLAEIAIRQNDNDTAVHSFHRWLDAFDARTGKKPLPERKAVQDQLTPLDSE